jgi:glutathione synthase/RimK-type ligase-like ATP-grasp enzyme
LIRSTWDYTLRRTEFLDWLRRVPRLHNPSSVVARNTDKGYLAELSRAGVPIVPTVFTGPGETLTLPTAGEYVLKPTVGAGSRGAGRFAVGRTGEPERARAHAAELHRLGRTVMLQPYLGRVDELGETALIFIDGEFSHAARKGQMLAEGTGYAADGDALFLEEHISPATPTGPELVLAEQVVRELSRSLDDTLLYARIDLLPSEAGPLLGEAELTEPSLFLPFAPSGEAAADRLIASILRRARRRPWVG